MDINDISKAITDQYGRALVNSDDFIERQRRFITAIDEAKEEREKNEEEKMNNLRLIAENSAEMVNSLKESNRLLEEQNESLELRLQGLYDTINQLADSIKETSQNRDEIMERALALAVQLNETADESRKPNWKEILSDLSIDTVILGLQIFLKQKGFF